MGLGGITTDRGDDAIRSFLVVSLVFRDKKDVVRPSGSLERSKE